jgi:signal transduction histidine kinase/putative methionine-R-sulfoxide reductase with GAF domain
MTAKLGNAAPDPQQIIAELQRKLDEAHAEQAARNSAYSERIAYQAAANDVLKVMSASPGDPQPVFDLIAVRARDICGAYGVTVCEFDGSLLHWRAATGISEDPAVREANKAIFPTPPTRDLGAGRAILDRATIHMRDHDTEPGLRRFSLTVKSSVAVPLMRGGVPIGTLQMGSRERGGFSDIQVELLKTFADQAVIAIGSAETYRALQARTTELQESLQQQTATADVLKVISASPGELAPVFGSLLASAKNLCGAEFGIILLREGDAFRTVALHGTTAAYTEARWRAPLLRPAADTGLGRVLETKQTVQIADVRAVAGYMDNPVQAPIVQLAGVRSKLSVPMLKEEDLIGVIEIDRQEVRPFTDKQIELVQNFAAQAVIAIENVRLLRELRESLQQQTATGDVLKVIASSPTDVGPSLKAIVESACELCEAYDCVALLKEGDHLRFSAHRGPISMTLETWPLNRRWVTGRSVIDQRVVHVHDLTAESEEFPEGQEMALSMGFRTVVSAPLIREGESIGAIILRRTEVSPFSEKQINLLQTFADQAVIAIGNVRLFEQVQERTRELSQSLDDLRSAQDRLVQTEKLASLGQLTAGIAHEIKNPLNFVNNFSALSAELTDELNDVLKPVGLDRKIRGEVDELTGLLKDNLEKVVQHGKRADAIVKNMLLHSREGSGEHRPTDINSLLEESLNLAYHGARAEKGEFNIILQRDFDADAGTIELFPQEITRAFLNLIANGVYAATRRKTEDKEHGFEPTLRASTKNLGNAVEIRIRDNGSGIPAEVQEKIFNPFFTTKPAGEGTGLGLSMTHDIIVKQHGGRINVATEPGQFTELTIVLPRKSNLSDRDRGKT